MSASKTHVILSELHRLLSNYRAADFVSASEYKGTAPNLKHALLALAEECRPERGGEEGKERASRSAVGREGGIDQRQIEERTILNAILDSARFKSARSVADFAKDLGLRIAVRPKDSRHRLARRLAQVISAQPEPRRSEIVGLLVRGNDQVQGWIDVIKSARP